MRRKGYTLIELVLAIALTAIVATCVSSLIGYAMTTRKMADAKTEMYTVSMRLHKAIAADISVSSDVVLLSRKPSSYTGLDAQHKVMYCDKGVVKTSNKSGTTNVLPITNGFNSYLAVTVESISFRLVKIVDHKDADTAETANFYRAVRITTTVSQGAWSYTHTSTVRFDEMLLTGSQVRVGDAGSGWSSATLNAAAASNEGTDYPFILYTKD